MSYFKNVLAVVFLAAGSVLPFTAQASHHAESPHPKTATSAKSGKKKAHAPGRALNYGAQLRMRNRSLLLAHAKNKQLHATPVIAGSARGKAALRAENRTYIEQHPEWFATPYRSHPLHLQNGARPADDMHLQNVTDRIISRLQRQLGKPYVWGGETPQEGFDCSGLVFFAFNKLLAAKLPRTANEMYHYRRAKDVADKDLQRGDLLFFHIHSRNKADHVGVYLGEGRFIESPRTGERIRISYLADDFWQAHFLGSKRILTANTVL